MDRSSAANTRKSRTISRHAPRSVTVWSDDESPNNEAAEYYEGVLEKLGFDATLKIVNADNYFTIVSNTSTPELDTGLIGGASHCAVQRVDFLDQVAFADASDRGVARHLAQRFQAVRHQQGGCAQACRCQASLGSGMTAPDDDDVKVVAKIHLATLGQGGANVVRRRVSIRRPSGDVSRETPRPGCST